MIGDNPIRNVEKTSSDLTLTTTTTTTTTHKREEIVFTDNVGLIPRMAKEIFQLMNKASPLIEYIVRVSYIEIYLEQIRDLLKPSTKFLKIYDGEEQSDYERRKGPNLEGLSEICCLQWTELIDVLFRANSFRIVNAERNQTDLKQSHCIFTIKIEQRNMSTGRTITSKMNFVDLAGNEQERQLKVHSPRSKTANSTHDNRESNLVNRSNLALNDVMKALEQYNDPSHYAGNTPPLPPHPDDIPYRESKLTRILFNCFGGNSYAAFVLTASVATLNISSTISTLRFGERCRRISNFPYINIEASPEECYIELEKSKKIQSELLILIKEIGKETKRMKDEGSINSLQDEGPLWNRINELCESNKYFALDDESAVTGTNTISMPLQDKLRRKEEDIMELRAKLREVRLERDKAQTRMLEMEGECVFLRNESEEVLAAKKRSTENIIDAQNEIQSLSQNKLELEHNLRTSRFRENEAISFARSFRRFYRNLLQNNAAHGTGSPKEIMLQMAGIPNLDDLIDIDNIMCESGLIEDYEVNSNMDNKQYNPSAKSFRRSASLASKARKASYQLTPQRQGTVDLTNASSGSTNITLSTEFEESGRNVIVIPTGSLSRRSDQSGRNEGLRMETPAGRLNKEIIDKLERDLLHITRQCIDLQLSLNELEEWREMLTMSKSQKKVMEASLKLKNELIKKESDMKALVWKMNEIQTINITFNEKLATKEEHVSYLEEKITQLQDKDSLQTYRQGQIEKNLRTEIMRLNTLLDATAKIHWQDGKKDHRNRLESRIIIPVQGGSSLDPNKREQLLQGIRAELTRGSISETEDGRTTTGVSYAPSYGPSVSSSIYVDKSQQLNNTIKVEEMSFMTPTKPSSQHKLEEAEKSCESTTPHSLFLGGKHASYEPRRTTKKTNEKILSARLKSLTTSSKLPRHLVSQEERAAQPKESRPKARSSSNAPKKDHVPKSLNETKMKLKPFDHLWSDKPDEETPKPSSISPTKEDRQKIMRESQEKLNNLESSWSSRSEF